MSPHNTLSLFVIWRFHGVSILWSQPCQCGVGGRRIRQRLLLSPPLGARVTPPVFPCAAGREWTTDLCMNVPRKHIAWTPDVGDKIFSQTSDTNSTLTRLITWADFTVHLYTPKFRFSYVYLHTVPSKYPDIPAALFSACLTFLSRL
jgi:hypothetical protein